MSAKAKRIKIDWEKQIRKRPDEIKAAIEIERNNRNERFADDIHFLAIILALYLTTAMIKLILS